MPPLGARAATPRERVLAQWRRVNLAPLEVAQTMRARSIAAVLPRVLGELRIDNRRAEAEVVKAWNTLLDPTLTAHTQPTGIRKGTLFVTVDSSVWLSEIVRYRREEILERLQNCFGRDLVARISFRVGG